VAAADKLAAETERQIAEKRAAMVKLPSVLGFDSVLVWQLGVVLHRYPAYFVDCLCQSEVAVAITISDEEIRTHSIEDYLLWRSGQRQ
jgi:hypothetical protein